MLTVNIQRTLLMIKMNKIFHSSIIFIFGAEGEHDMVEKLTQIIDLGHLLNYYAIHRRLDKFLFTMEMIYLFF